MQRVLKNDYLLVNYFGVNPNITDRVCAETIFKKDLTSYRRKPIIEMGEKHLKARPKGRVFHFRKEGSEMMRIGGLEILILARALEFTLKHNEDGSNEGGRVLSGGRPSESEEAVAATKLGKGLLTRLQSQPEAR